jgi:hypothetical protein
VEQADQVILQEEVARRPEQGLMEVMVVASMEERRLPAVDRAEVGLQGMLPALAEVLPVAEEVAPELITPQHKMVVAVRMGK